MNAPSFDALWDYARPGETETKFLALLPEYEAAGDPGPLAELLTQIARTLGLQQEFEKAHAMLDRADSMIAAGARSAGGGASAVAPLGVARVRSLLERGRVHNSAGERDRAAPLFHEAYQLALALGADYHAVDAAHMLEIVETGMAKLDWNAIAVTLAEASHDARARRWLGALYNNRGWTLHELGRLDEALAAFEKRLEWLEANPPEEGRDRHETDVGIAHWSIAKMFRLLGRVDEALVIQERLLETKGAAADGYVPEELAECLYALGREAEARPRFAQAYDMLSQDPWLVRNEAVRLERLAELARDV